MSEIADRDKEKAAEARLREKGIDVGKPIITEALKKKAYGKYYRPRGELDAKQKALLAKSKETSKGVSGWVFDTALRHIEQNKADERARVAEMAKTGEKPTWTEKMRTLPGALIGGAAEGIAETFRYVIGDDISENALEARRNNAFEHSEARKFFLKSYANTHGEEAAKKLDEDRPTQT